MKRKICALTIDLTIVIAIIGLVPILHNNLSFAACNYYEVGDPISVFFSSIDTFERNIVSGEVAVFTTVNFEVKKGHELPGPFFHADIDGWWQASTCTITTISDGVEYKIELDGNTYQDWTDDISSSEGHVLTWFNILGFDTEGNHTVDFIVNDTEPHSTPGTTNDSSKTISYSLTARAPNQDDVEYLGRVDQVWDRYRDTVTYNGTNLSFEGLYLHEEVTVSDDPCDAINEDKMRTGGTTLSANNSAIDEVGGYSENVAGCDATVKQTLYLRESESASETQFPIVTNTIRLQWHDDSAESIETAKETPSSFASSPGYDIFF